MRSILADFAPYQLSGLNWRLNESRKDNMHRSIHERVPYGEKTTRRAVKGLRSLLSSSSETQGHIVGARESLNGRKNKARRNVKNREKSPWGQSLNRPVPNGRRRSGFWLVPEKHKFSGTNQKPERPRPFGTGLIRHWPQGLFSLFFTFLRPIHIFFARLDFPSPLYLPMGLRGCSLNKIKYLF